MRLIKILAQFGVLFMLVGCSSASKLENYSRRRIDRPILLLQGMNEAVIQIPLGYRKVTEYYDIQRPLPYYVYWAHALSDDFSFIWYGLPLGFRFKVLNAGSHQVRMEFFGHLGPPVVPYLSPYLTLKHRYRMSEWGELETQLGSQTVFQLKRGGIDWALALSTGPRFQLIDALSLRPWISLLREMDPSSNVLSAPIGIELEWSVAKQWDTEISFFHSGLGQKLNDTGRPNFSMQFRYYW